MKCSFWYYILGVTIFVLGQILSILVIIQGIMFYSAPGQIVELNNKTDVILSKIGGYTIFYEYQGRVENEIYVLGKQDLAKIQCVLYDKTNSKQITLSHYLPKYQYFINDINDRKGIALFTFLVDRLGTYELSAFQPNDYNKFNPILIIKYGSHSIIRTLLIAFAIEACSFLAGFTVLIITYLKRRNCHKFVSGDTHLPM